MNPAITALAHAPAIDCRPMSLSLKHALIAMDIEHELLRQVSEAAPSLPDGVGRLREEVPADFSGGGR